MKFTIVLFLVISLSSCSWLWSEEQCDGEDCDVPTLIEEKPEDKTWTCFGDENQQWQCEGQRKSTARN